MDLSSFKFNGKQIPSEYRERVLGDLDAIRVLIDDFEADPKSELCLLIVRKDEQGDVDMAQAVCAMSDTIGVFLLAMVDMVQQIGGEKKKVLRDEWLKRFVQRG